MKIASYLPKAVLKNEEFEVLGWDSEKIYSKTKIKLRHIAGENEYALDLAVNACNMLFDNHDVSKNEIDYLIYCTQSPDTLLPNNCSVLQERLGLGTHIGSFDINQGCTGYIYGLSIAEGLLLSKQATNLLLVTADTYSKYICDDDRTNRTIFGDGATASHITTNDVPKIGPFVFGTDGRGADKLCVKGGGLRNHDNNGQKKLYMDGPAVYSFALAHVPDVVNKLLEKIDLSIEDIDHYVFHQANGYMLEYLRKKIGIPQDKFHIYLENVGNTVSSTIPITLEYLEASNLIKEKQRMMLVGFGIGYSWNATIMYT